LTTDIIGQGKFKLKLMDGRIRTLPGVLHILGLARNLISVRKMDDVGVQIVFYKESYKMDQGKMVLLKGVQIGTLYKLVGSTIWDGRNNFVFPEIGDEEEKNPTVYGEKTMLWHKMLGHIGEKGLQVLDDKNMVEGMSKFSLDFYLCEHCIYWKKTWVRIPSGATRAKEILELVHNDVFGPVSVPSLGKFVYYVSFIDDF
jgi:hypothetical protein